MPSDQFRSTPQGDILLSENLSLRSPEIESIHPLAESSSCSSLPLFGCRISAGFPSPASDYLEQELNIHDFMVEHPSSTFILRVAGDSMMGVGILNHDYLVVDRSQQVRHNDIVVAVVHGELTVKRFCKAGQTVELRPENPEYPVIPVKGEIDLLIWGVVIGVFRKH